MAPGLRPFALLVVGASLVLLLWSALAEGDDHAVRTFRGATLLFGATLPLAAVRVAASPYGASLGGGALLLLLLAGFVHRALSARRRAGTAERLILAARLTFEATGILLFLASAALLWSGHTVPLRLAFWALFLLRLSIADLLDPSRLAGKTGLKKSVKRDLKAVRTGAGRRRLSRLLAGLSKVFLLAVWMALPLAAALAPGEVAAGAWPHDALVLRIYPAAALGLTALLLAGNGFRLIWRRPAEGARSLVAGVATGLYLVGVFGDASFEAYRHSLAGLYLAETVAGFLLGTVSRGR